MDESEEQVLHILKLYEKAWKTAKSVGDKQAWEKLQRAALTVMMAEKVMEAATRTGIKAIFEVKTQRLISKRHSFKTSAFEMAEETNIAALKAKKDASQDLKKARKHFQNSWKAWASTVDPAIRNTWEMAFSRADSALNGNDSNDGNDTSKSTMARAWHKEPLNKDISPTKQA